MPKSLRTFLDDFRRVYPNDVVSIAKTVNPLTYDITAIVKHLGALKKFPVLVFENPLNARGQPTDMKVVMSAENSRRRFRSRWDCRRTSIAPRWRGNVYVARRAGSGP